MSPTKGSVLAVVLLMLLVGCETVRIQPSLDSSLSTNAFYKMKKIDLKDVSLGLYIDPKIKDLKWEQKIQLGEYTFDIGQALSVKLIKALAYNFKTIYLLDRLAFDSSDEMDAVMYVALQDVDISLDVKSGWSKVAAESYARIALRAEIKDTEENKTVWVGTTQAKYTGKHEEHGAMNYQEAGRGFAEVINKAIDEAIGDLIHAMTKSKNLQKYFRKWERRHVERENST
jgi:hypothetical protein